MKERIKSIMEAENMTPARFADNLEIGRAVISHILNGRNNPSLDVITRILTKIPTINSNWLLTGKGSMYKTDDSIINEAIHIDQKSQNGGYPDLFSQLQSENSVKADNYPENVEYQKENILNGSLKDVQNIMNERIIYKEAPVKKIKQIIIYYTDNTFETFNRE